MQSMVKAAFICEYAMTSADGKLSAIGIFSNINFPNLPNAHPRFFVVVILNLPQGTHTVSLDMLNPVGQSMMGEAEELPVEVEIPGADTQIVFDLPYREFTAAGIHQVQMFVNRVLVHSIPLNVATASGTGFAPSRQN